MSLFGSIAFTAREEDVTQKPPSSGFSSQLFPRPPSRATTPILAALRCLVKIREAACAPKSDKKGGGFFPGKLFQRRKDADYKYGFAERALFGPHGRGRGCSNHALINLDCAMRALLALPSPPLPGTYGFAAHVRVRPGQSPVLKLR